MIFFEASHTLLTSLISDPIATTDNANKKRLNGLDCIFHSQFKQYCNEIYDELVRLLENDAYILLHIFPDNEVSPS